MTNPLFSILKLSEKYLELAKQRLSDHPEIIRLLEKKGLKRKTIATLPIGLTEDLEVFFPLYAWDTENSFEPIGAIVYNEFLLNGVTHLFSRSRWAFLGFKHPVKTRDVILARDPFEFACIWQEWYDDVWLIPDNRCIPYSTKNWNQLIFTNHTQSDIIAYRWFFISSYGMDESYVEWDISKLTPEAISNSDSSIMIFSNPFMLVNKLCFIIKRSGFLSILDSSGELYPIRYNKFKGTATFVHPTQWVVECMMTAIYGSQSLFPISTYDTYHKLYTYLKSKLFFLTRDQLMIFTSFIMYQWIAPHCELRFHLQVFSYQDQWITHIYNVLLELTPRWLKNVWDKEISSILHESIAHEDAMVGAPHIFIGRPVTTSRGAWGLPLIIDAMNGNDHNNFPYRNNIKSVWLRDMLFNFALAYKPSIEDQAAKYNHLIPFSMILWQVYKDYYGRKQKVIAEVFSKGKNWIRNNYDRPYITQANFFETWKKAPPLSKRSKTIAKLNDTKQNESTQEKSPSEDEDGCN